ncbi:MAG: SH3 domain-containing protein [Caldilinea sp.]|nr:SH3 domain-containing protein [Caldilinea sp.]MDW8442602.1 SH3 domain-containing protein [Caldilineaceae bacterium]
MRILSAVLLLAVFVGLAVFFTFTSSWGALWSSQVQETPTVLAEEPSPTPTPDWSGKFVVDIVQPTVLRAAPAPAAEIVAVLRRGERVALSGCNVDLLWCQTEDGAWLLSYMVGEVPGDLPILDAAGLTMRDLRDRATPTPEPTPTPTLEPTPQVNLLQLLPTPTPTPAGVEAVVLDTANLRAGPGTEFERVGSVRAGDTLRLVGRLADGSWYQLENGAWIAAFLVEAPVAELPVVAVDGEE